MMNNYVQNIEEELSVDHFVSSKEKNSEIIEKFLFYHKYSFLDWLLSLRIKMLFIKFVEKFLKINSLNFWIPYIALNRTKWNMQIFERFGHNPPVRSLSKLVVDDKGTWYGCRIFDTETKESKVIEIILNKKKFLDLIK